MPPAAKERTAVRDERAFGDPDAAPFGTGAGVRYPERGKRQSEQRKMERAQKGTSNCSIGTKGVL